MSAPVHADFTETADLIARFVKDAIDRVTPQALAVAAEVDNPELVAELIDKATIELDVQWDTDEEGNVLAHE